MSELPEIFKANSPDEVLAAIQAGAGVNAVHFCETTALMFHCGAFCPDDPNNSNARGWKGITRPAVIAALISAGANVNAKDRYNCTALWYLANQDDPNLDAIVTLLKAGADVNAGDSVLMAALSVTRKRERNRDAVVAMLEAGADANARLRNGATALMLSTSWPYPEIMAALLKRGADVRAKDQMYQTALDWAIRRNNSDAIALLSQAGAKLFD